MSRMENLIGQVKAGVHYTLDKPETRFNSWWMEKASGFFWKKKEGI